MLMKGCCIILYDVPNQLAGDMMKRIDLSMTFQSFELLCQDDDTSSHFYEEKWSDLGDA